MQTPLTVRKRREEGGEYRGEESCREGERNEKHDSRREEFMLPQVLFLRGGFRGVKGLLTREAGRGHATY